MIDKKIKLINFMLENQEIHTASELADTLDFSVRTLKNYIYMMNREYNEDIIYSSKRGYKIIERNALAYLRHIDLQRNKQIPQNVDERLDYINKKIYNGDSEVDIYQLCDELYISITTLKNELLEMNESMAKMDAYYLVEEEKLKLIASEKSIRRIRNDMLFKELGQNFINIEKIKEEFDFIDVEAIVLILNNNLTKYNQFVNDLSFFNLTLHLVILIERVIDGNPISKNVSGENIIKNPFVLSIVHDLIKELEFDISDGDKYEIYLLIISNINCNSVDNMQVIVDYVGDEVNETVSEIIRIVEKQYGFLLKSDSFLTAFSMHLKNLLLRVKNNTFIRNPMNQMIQENNPLIYEIALYISYYLEKKYECMIDVNETTYLVLHIGAEIERMKIEKDRISTILFCPDYLDFPSQIQHYINKNFNDSIYIKRVINSLHGLEDMSFELLICISDLNEVLPYKTVKISPFNLEGERQKLEKVINHMKMEKKINSLLTYFDSYFRKEHFYVQDKSIRTKEDVIQKLCDSLYNKQCVSKEYYDHIWERENMAKTSFLKVAIPHTMQMDAYKTSVAVMVCKDGINWADCKVNLVLMIALNEIDRFKFANLYDTLFDLFGENENIRVIKDCTNFEEFELCLRKML